MIVQRKHAGHLGVCLFCVLLFSDITNPVIPYWSFNAVSSTPDGGGNALTVLEPVLPVGRERFTDWDFQLRCVSPFPAKPVGKVSLSDWMGKIPGADSLTVDEMVWPGTHDTGAYSNSKIDYALPASGFTNNKWWKDFVDSGFSDPAIPGVTPEQIVELLQNITTTHEGASVYQQLMDGVRFLDLRVARSFDSSDRNYYLVHEYVVSNLTEVLNDILRFVEEHPSEVLLVKILPKSNIDGVELMQYVENFRSPSGQPLRNYAFMKDASLPGDHRQAGTIGEMVKSGKRILLNWDASPPTTDPTIWFYWRESFFLDRFRGFDQPAGKQDFLISEINRLYTSPKNGKVFQLAFTLTPDAQDAIWDMENIADAAAGIASHINQPGLEGLAMSMNPTLRHFLFDRLNKTQRDFVNIFTVDYYHEHRDALWSVTRKLLEERLHKITPDCNGTWYNVRVPIGGKSIRIPLRLVPGHYQVRARAVGPRDTSLFLASLSTLLAHGKWDWQVKT